MSDLNRKALLWIQKFGRQKDQIAETGLPNPTLTKLLDKEGKYGRRKGVQGKVTLDHINHIAKARRVYPSDVVLDIERVELEDAGIPRRGTLEVMDQARIAWEELFASDPLRGKRVLKNLQHQEALGYTDLISEVVRLVIDLGPAEAAPVVNNLLHEAGKKSRETPKMRERRAAMAKEYRQIR